MNDLAYRICDYIVSLPIIRIFKPLYNKYRKFFVYVFLGGISYLLNLSIYLLFNRLFHVNEIIANVLAWFIHHLIMFVIYGTYYFGKTDDSFIVGLLKFYLSRGGTFVLDMSIFYTFIKVLGFYDVIVKTITTLLLAIINYYFSKKFVYKK